MSTYTFGSYLRELRASRTPPMTQEALAKVVGRSKMTISQFEQNKNAPPQGALLNSLVKVLELSREEESMIRFLAAESRNSIPDDLTDYFFSHPAICDAIRAARDNKLDNNAWQLLANSFEKADIEE